MQYEQTTAHMEDSSNHSSISFEQTINATPRIPALVWVYQAIQK